MSANRIKKKIAEQTLHLKEKSAEVQKFLHFEAKKLAKIEEQIRVTKEGIAEEEKRQLELAERGQGKMTAVREAEMFRAKKCSQLEVRLSRSRQNMSKTEDENQQIRSKIDELRRLIMCQTEVYETCSATMKRVREEQAADLLHSDNVLFEKEILTKKIEEIVEKNALEIEDAERLLQELTTFIEREAKASKEFYERQMKETPVFDDSFKESMVAEIKSRALKYAEEKAREAEIEEELAHIKDAFARLRDEAIGDQSFDDAVAQYISVESDCIKIMSYIRAKEVEVEVEEEMLAKFEADITVHAGVQAGLERKLAEVDVLVRERDSVQEEEDRLKRDHGKLKQQMGRWAGALNSVFKALSVDLESLGIYGGRVTADADLVTLMGVVEARGQRTLGSYNKFLAAGGNRRGGSAGSATASVDSGSRSQPQSPSSRGRGTPGELPLPPAASPGGLSLPRIRAGSFGVGSPDDRGNDFALLASDEEDDFSDDENDFVKPMSSIDLKRSMHGSLSIGSIASPKGGAFNY